MTIGLLPRQEASFACNPATNQHLPQSVIQRSHSRNQHTAEEDEAVPDLTDEPPQPRAIHYQEPSFSLEQPDRMLQMHERIEVHNNYISTISNKLHAIHLIDKLKKSEPHNAAHYQAELGRLLVCHDDVINWVLNIMKMDDYYRQVEELPVMDTLTTYGEIQCYPGLFDMQQVMCRITTEADIHERQLHRRGMYPICDSPVHTTSVIVPHRPLPTFKQTDYAAPTPASGSVSDSQGSAQQNSPVTDSSLPCGQCTPQGTSTTSSQQSHKGTSNQQTDCHAFTQYTPTECCIMVTFCTSTSTTLAVSWCAPATAATVSTTSSCITGCTPATRSAAIHTTQGWPQGEQNRQQRYSSPFMQNFNPPVQPFIPAVEAQQKSMPNTQEPKVPMSADVKGVKKQLSNRQGVLPMQTTRTPQERLP